MESVLPGFFARNSSRGRREVTKWPNGVTGEGGFHVQPVNPLRDRLGSDGNVRVIFARLLHLSVGTIRTRVITVAIVQESGSIHFFLFPADTRNSTQDGLTGSRDD